MNRSEKIKSSLGITKVAYAYSQGYPDPNVQTPYMDQSWGAWDTVGAGMTAAYTTPKGLQYLKAAPTTIGGKIVNRGLPGLGIAMGAYGAANSALDAKKDFNRSGFGGGGVGGAVAYLGTTGGMNRLADTMQNGSLTLAGAGIGAGIGALAGGVGAVPGALIGSTIGGAAELGMHGYRALTGWDGNKYQMARISQDAGKNPAEAAQITQQALNNKSGTPMFQTKTFFGLGGNRDLLSEAKDDLKKEQAFATANRPLPPNPAPPTL